MPDWSPITTFAPCSSSRSGTDLDRERVRGGRIGIGRVQCGFQQHGVSPVRSQERLSVAVKENIPDCMRQAGFPADLAGTPCTKTGFI